MRLNEGQEMIARQIFLSVVSFLTVFGLSLQAWSLELSTEYLLGKWVIQGTACSDSGSEFVIFRDSGAVEAVRAGKLEAAGFWEIDDEIVVFHVTASPAFFLGAFEEDRGCPSRQEPCIPSDEFK